MFEVYVLFVVVFMFMYMCGMCVLVDCDGVKSVMLVVDLYESFSLTMSEFVYGVGKCFLIVMYDVCVDVFKMIDVEL